MNKRQRNKQTTTTVFIFVNEDEVLDFWKVGNCRRKLLFNTALKHQAIEKVKLYNGRPYTTQTD